MVFKKKRQNGRPFVKGDDPRRTNMRPNVTLENLPLVCRSSNQESEPLPEEGKSVIVTSRLRPSKKIQNTFYDSKEVLGEFHYKAG